MKYICAIFLLLVITSNAGEIDDDSDYNEGNAPDSSFGLNAQGHNFGEDSEFMAATPNTPGVYSGGFNMRGQEGLNINENQDEQFGPDFGSQGGQQD
jgi:hypothetical protein